MCMKLRRGDWFYVKFQFERLPAFCFYCGIVGHSEQVCEKLYDDPYSEKRPLPYGPNLRVSGKKILAMDGSRWIRDDGRGQGSAAKTSDDTMHVDAHGSLHGKYENLGENLGANQGPFNAAHEGPYEVMGKDSEYGKVDQDEDQKISQAMEGDYILDTKRKRVEIISAESKSGNEVVISLSNVDKLLPKNVLEVGPSSQAHLSQ